MALSRHQITLCAFIAVSIAVVSGVLLHDTGYYTAEEAVGYFRGVGIGVSLVLFVVSVLCMRGEKS